MDQENKITEKVIGACFDVHRKLGPGFPEKIYQYALEKVFTKEGIKFVAEHQYDVFFEDEKIGNFKADFLIEDLVILEIKSVVGFMPKVFEAQVISYLKAAALRAGLLVNFGDVNCKVRRINIDRIKK